MLDLLICVDVWPGPLRPIWQQTLGRYLSPRVYCALIAGKTAYEAQPPRPFSGLDGFGFLGPIEGKSRCDVTGSFALHERNKIAQAYASIIQLESQAAPHLEVVLKGAPQPGHHAPPGQAKARVCSEDRSTFA